MTVSKRTRQKFIDFASEGVLRQIEAVFRAEDFEPAPEGAVTAQGQRRTLAARFDAGVGDGEDVHLRLVRVYLDGVDEWGRDERGGLSKSAQSVLQSLRNDGFAITEDGRLEASGARVKRALSGRPGGKLFISHSVRDAELAEALQEMLRLGTDLPAASVFLSSLPETGVPGGEDFVEYMRRELVGAKVVLQLITPAYFESAFCLCELGVQWGLGLPCVPLVVPPVTYADLTGVLGQIQAGVIDRTSSLDELYDRVRTAFGLEPPTAQWSRQRDKFTNQLPGLLARIAPASQVERAAYDNAVSQLANVLEELERTKADLAGARDRLEALATLKDTAEAAAVLADGDVEMQFQETLRAAKEALRPLPSIVREALFHDVSGLPFLLRQEEWDAAEREVANGRLTAHEWSDGTYEVNTNDPPARRALAAVRQLRDFAPDKGLIAKFEQTHDVALDFTNRRAWEAVGLL